MRQRCSWGLAALLTILPATLPFAGIGCSSETGTTKQSPPPDTGRSVVSSTALAITRPDTTQQDTVSAGDDIVVNSDSLIAFRLEQARQHYLSAMSADAAGDTLRATTQFELAIQILNDLSYYPDIEGNLDFNDLSRTVIEDYEKYIQRTGTIDSTGSIFALREKLNQLLESVDTAAVEPPRAVITTTTIPLVVNNLVERHIEFFRTRGRQHMERWLERSGKYFPLLRRILREEGVPEDLVYLAMIESGLNPLARSWARAVGMWQFMRGTGALYGLRGNFWYDDRRDFEKATRAAARHLRDLYEDFEDWYLAMAAYNSGAGKVYRAMRRSGSSDFWQLRRYLPRETRNYVPAYIAAALITMNPQEHGFDVRPADSLDFDYVTVDECVDLEVLAECAGADVETLRELNPQLIHRCTPPSTEGYRLRVPRSTDKEAFKARYAALPESKKGYWLTHVAKRGDTVPKLARHYGVSERVLAEANNLSTRATLRRGTHILIPIARATAASAAVPALEPAVERSRPSAFRTQARSIRSSFVPVRSDQTRIIYTIKPGDTIGHIAEWFGVRATDIRTWNNLPFGRKIIAGQTLVVYVDSKEADRYRRIDGMTFEEKMASVAQRSAPKQEEVNGDGGTVYIVKRGDTLHDIARRHNVTVRQLQRWNDLTSSVLKPGMKLVIYPPVTSDAAPSTRSKTRENQIVYVVRKGDTISRIASAHNVSEPDLRKWNSLTRTNKIYAGQELIIRKDAQ